MGFQFPAPAGRRGASVWELLAVVFIISLLVGMAVFSSSRYGANRQISAGIKQVVILNHALNQYATACQGYPAPGESLDEILSHTPNPPRIYPQSLLFSGSNPNGRCTGSDGGLLGTLPRIFAASSVDCNTGLCTSRGDPFVVGTASTYCPDGNITMNGSNFDVGWNVVSKLPKAGGASQHMSNPTVAVCGNLKDLKGNYVTVVVNSDDAGKYYGASASGGGNPDDLPDACVNGPWCYSSAKEAQGETSTGCCGSSDLGYRF